MAKIDLKKLNASIQEAGAEENGNKPAPIHKSAEVSSEVSEAAKGLPSPHRDDLRAKLRDRVQFNFSHMPRYLKEMFQEAAAAKGMKDIEYLYYLMRQDGLDVPPYKQMDLRKL